MRKCISVFGLRYVGSLTAACFASLGHRVIGVDVNPAKVEMVEAGRSPILEARMDELVAEGRSSGLLCASTDGARAVAETELSFIAVGTPSRANGQLDLAHVEHACREIGEGLRGKSVHHWVVLRSTVLPGTTEGAVIPLLESASGRRAGQDFSVVYNPEFMREGSAVEDFFEPPYTILGARPGTDLTPLRQLYAWAPGRRFETSLVVAEVAKYASNAFHAMKVSFANELGTLSKHLGADAEQVMEIFTSDTRLNISAAYLAPGFAFGGSCLPKDLRALNYRARQLDLRLPLLDAVLGSNREHIERSVELILSTGKRRVALLGLSFKAGTDDLRESAQVTLAKCLIAEGRELRIWDNQVTLGCLAGSNREFIEQVIPHIGQLMVATVEEAVREAEVVVVATQLIEAGALRAILRPGQTVIDLVNLEKARRLPGQVEGVCW